MEDGTPDELTPQIHGVPSSEFVSSLLPLYSSSPIKIHLAISPPKTYTLPISLLTSQSPYFHTTFHGPFLESHTASTTLTPIPDVLTQRSFELLIQRLYLGHVVFPPQPSPTEHITLILEFARLCDMFSVIGVEHTMASQIKDLIKINKGPYSFPRHPDTNTYILTRAHMLAAFELPQGHAVRRVMAEASVEGYLRWDQYKFVELTREVEGFAGDLLECVKEVVKGVVFEENVIGFRDPVSGERVRLTQYRG